MSIFLAFIRGLIDKSIQRRKLFVKIQYLPSFSMGVKEPRGGAPGAL